MKPENELLQSNIDKLEAVVSEYSDSDEDIETVRYMKRLLSMLDEVGAENEQICIATAKS